MPKIKLMIGGRPYEVACNEGDEERVQVLSERLNQRVARVAGALGSTASESMILVVTALTMEDELASLVAGETPVANDTPPQAYNTSPPSEEQINRRIAEVLEPFAERIEALANKLEME